MKRIAYISLVTLLLLSGTIKGQFAKPLPKKRNAWAEANYNLGIIGGISATRWFFQGGTSTKYEQPYTTIAIDATFLNSIRNNALFGLSLERRLGDFNSLGLEVMYANRNTILGFRESFPTSSNAYSEPDTTRLNYQYSELLIQFPISQYLFDGERDFRPYVFIAPRISLPITGQIQMTRTTIPDPTTIDITSNNMRTWNIGAVAGVGFSYRVQLSDYYYCMIKLDASCHFGFLNTFSDYERGIAVDEDGNPVTAIDAITGKPIDPQLIGRRYFGNATVKLALVFPITKILKGAYKSWGEY